MYDLIVIGGGPGGYRAAECAGKAGLSVLLAEKRALGGVCLNEGCIPSKTLLHSAKIYDYALHGGAYGISAQGAVIDHAKVIARKNKVVGKLTCGVKALMKQHKVTVIDGEALIIDKNTISVNGEQYTADRMIIATGSEPVIPPIPGVEEGLKTGHVLTSRGILDLETCPERLVIIGAGAVGLEMAAYYNTTGSSVTVIEMLPKIAGTADTEIAAALMDAYKKRGIEFLLETRAAAITDSGVKLESMKSSGKSGTNSKAKAAQPDYLPADKILLSIGRKPVTAGFGLENTDVALENGAVLTDEHCLTSIPNIYAAGDVNGKYMLAHAAYREAEVAVNHILGKHDVMRYDAVPSVIYTSPEAAFTGETEETARAKGIECQSVMVPMAYSGRHVAENEDAGGICKIVIGSRHRNIIGVHLLGSYASEIIASACVMVEMHMRTDDVKQIIFPHPAVGETIREAVFRI